MENGDRIVVLALTILFTFLLVYETAYAENTVVILPKKDMESIPSVQKETTQSNQRSSIPKHATDILIGDVFETGQIEAVVTTAELKNQLGSAFLYSRAAEGGVYVAVRWMYKNISTKPLSAADRPKLLLLDHNGVQYRPDLQATLAYASQLDITEKALSDLNPGVQVQGAVVFEVSKKLFNRDAWMLLVKADRNVEVSLRQKVKKSTTRRSVDGKSSAAQDDTPKIIEGAFGVLLGEIIDITNATNKGDDVFQFTPSKPFRAFTEYKVFITPISHKVYGIWAIGELNDTTENGFRVNARDVCEKEKQVVIQILKDKYGSHVTAEEKWPPTNEWPQPLWMQGVSPVLKGGNVTVGIDCAFTGFNTASIHIIYVDAALLGLAEKQRSTYKKEELRKKAKELDSSGL